MMHDAMGEVKGHPPIVPFHLNHSKGYAPSPWFHGPLGLQTRGPSPQIFLFENNSPNP
jgi:hypothetical protein